MNSTQNTNPLNLNTRYKKLDTEVYIKNNKLYTKIYRKKADR